MARWFAGATLTLALGFLVGRAWGGAAACTLLLLWWLRRPRAHERIDVARLDVSPLYGGGNRVRERIPTAVRRYVLWRDGYRCQRCHSRHQLEIDHVVPVARGGSNHPSNLQPLCGPCNRRKGARLYG